MKKIILATSALILTAGFSIAAIADDTTTTTTSTTTTASAEPCKNIKDACMSAGFTKGGKAGKNLMKDCMKPIMAGKEVSGVTVDANDVQACQAKKAGKHHHGKESATNTGTTTTTTDTTGTTTTQQ